MSVGKKGVFEYEEDDDRSMKEQRIEHDSDLQAVFGEEALQASEPSRRCPQKEKHLQCRVRPWIWPA